MRFENGNLSFSGKLPRSKETALNESFTEPTHYGLGRHGWVTANFTVDAPNVSALKAWIEESYRAVAPKKLQKQIAE